MENMFELLAETQEVRRTDFSQFLLALTRCFSQVTEAYNALPLRIKHAGVFFNNVSFAYDTGSR